MTDFGLESLLGAIEANWVQHKQSDTDKDKLCEASRAFANDRKDRR